MKSADAMLPDERRQLIAAQLRELGSISVAALEEQYGISPMTARRDLTELERQGIARRTHGGAVLPGPSAHEDSLLSAPGGCRRGERAARRGGDGAALARRGLVIDSSTTWFFAARRIVWENVRDTIITNSVPVMELVCESEAPQVKLIGVGGRCAS